MCIVRQLCVLARIGMRLNLAVDVVNNRTRPQSSQWSWAVWEVDIQNPPVRTRGSVSWWKSDLCHPAWSNLLPRVSNAQHSKYSLVFNLKYLHRRASNWSAARSFEGHSQFSWPHVKVLAETEPVYFIGEMVMGSFPNVLPRTHLALLDFSEWFRRL